MVLIVVGKHLLLFDVFVTDPRMFGAVDRIIGSLKDL
jgi:hypothetical protein